MKTLKLIWLSDRLHLRFYSRPILNDTYFALAYGPIGSGTKDLVEGTSFLSKSEKDYRDLYITQDGEYHFRSLKELDEIVFSQTDLNCFDKIFAEFGGMNEFELSDETHHYPEWKKFESRLESNETSRFQMNYEDSFVECSKNENDIFCIDIESLQISKELFRENGYIYQLV